MQDNRENQQEDGLVVKLELPCHLRPLMLCHSALLMKFHPLTMDLMGFWVVLDVLLAVAAAGEHLTRKVGEDVTFSLGARVLKQNDGLTWSYGPNNTVLFNIYIGEDVVTKQSSRYKLDLTTGSLTIQGLLANDTAVYRGQIFNGNGTNQFFNLTVE
ncbi:hypothetical protein ATANTOWER_008029, partial [Ataeniobius toweri]|nr:hypothetical protein [Ataeniobius toweri]